jgi:hypothetical protein
VVVPSGQLANIKSITHRKEYVALSEIAKRLQSDCALKPMLKNNTSPNSEVLLLFFFLLFLCKRTKREKKKNK